MRMKIDAKRLSKVISSLTNYRDEVLINVSENGMVTRVNEHSNTALQAAFIPSDAMKEWSVGEFPKLGIDIEQLESYIPSSGDVTLEVVQSGGKLYKLELKTDDREYRFGLLDPETVSGVPDQTPELDNAVKITNSYSFIDDFINDYGKGMGDKKSGYMYLSSRDGFFYLWANSDDSEMIERIHLEDFDDYDVDWSNVKPHEKVGHDESKEHTTDCIMSMGYLSLTETHTDKVNIYVDNHYPMKITSNWECGIKQSWMIPPRIPSEGNRATIPKRVIKERSVTA